MEFESEPSSDIQDDVMVESIDDECNFNVDIDFQLSSDLLPLNLCRYVVELDFIAQQLKQCSKCENRCGGLVVSAFAS